MDISTGNWFEYLREEVLTEGLRDIGLPEYIVDYIENGMAQSPEKSKTYVGNEWKKYELNQAYRTRLQVELVAHLVRQYGDYVMLLQRPLQQNLEVGARTITPFSTNDPDRQRQEYDDEMKKRAEQVKFVIQNLKNVIAKPAGAWRKAFMKAVKALSKTGIPSEKVEFTKEFLQTFMKEEFRTFWNKYDLLFSWLNDEPTNYELIKGESNINTAYDTAREELESRQDPENIIHEFEDGSYWYNLDVSTCSVEGERMGHCGSTPQGILVSLRKRKGKRKAPTSYVTMAWDADAYGGGTIYQIKGRANDAPPIETWDHIDWFIKNEKVEIVHETGQHSNDQEGIQEMIDYLQTKNRGIKFAGVVNEEELQEAVDGVVNDYEGENSSISGEVYESGPDDFYVRMDGYANLQIDLGWKGFEYRNNEFTPTLGPDDTTQDERFETIPENTWGGGGADFISDTEIENISWDLPGEDSDISWEVTMLTGADPNWELGDPEPAPTAHLEVTFNVAEQEPIPTGDPDDDPAESAARIAENFASELMGEFEENYEEIVEKVRSKLAEEGYSAKTSYDREREGMTETALENWKVYQNGPRLEFWFRRGKNDPGGLINSGGDLTSFSEEVMMWGHSPTGQGGLDALYRKTFGSPEKDYRIENNDLNRNMARNLENLYSAAEAAPSNQQQLAFGDEYEAPPAFLVLAKDSHFIIKPSTTRRNNRYPAMLLNWKYEIAVSAKSSSEEVEVVKEIVKYFNENPDMVEEAAAQTIRSAVEGIMALARATKEDVLSGKWPQHAIQSIDSQFGARAMAGDDTTAEQIILTTKWIKDNFDQMGEPEKYVAWFYYLKPMKEGYYQPYNNPIYIGGENEPGEAGQPQHWNERVQQQLDKMGAYSHTVRDYSITRDTPVGESIEQQINRIDKMLSEFIDVRRYGMELELLIETAPESTIEDYKDAVRACEGVTTLQTLQTYSVGNLTGATFRLKFVLEGQVSRKLYLQQKLIPYINKINGIKFGPAGYSMPQEILPLREYSGGFGGRVSNLGAMRRPDAAMPTPRQSLEDIVDEWVYSGKKAYDVPMFTNSMQYHVMMPTEELWPYKSREFRAPMDGYDGMYQNFIANGPTAPVHVTIDKRGNISMKNEDIVWFAHESGLDAVPVIFTFAQQA